MAIQVSSWTWMPGCQKKIEPASPASIPQAPKQHHREWEPLRTLELNLTKPLAKLRRCEVREEVPLAQDHTAQGSQSDSNSPGA